LNWHGGLQIYSFPQGPEPKVRGKRAMLRFWGIRGDHTTMWTGEGVPQLYEVTIWYGDASKVVPKLVEGDILLLAGNLKPKHHINLEHDRINPGVFINADWHMCELQCHGKVKDGVRAAIRDEEARRKSIT